MKFALVPAFRRSFVLVSVIAATLVAPSAHAVIYAGTPNLGFTVARPQFDYVSGSVYLTKVRVHKCAGGYTDYAVGQTIDPVDGYSLGIASGNYCSLTFYWGSTMEIDGPAYSLEYDEATTTVPLATEIAPVALTPYDVVSGSMTGGGPKLLTLID